MPKVTYKGPTRKGDPATRYVTNDNVVLPRNTPVEVSDEEAKLLLGDDSPTGHRFVEGDDDSDDGGDAAAAATADDENQGPGGTSGGDPDPAGTATSRRRR
jgi:hypothetical protein